MINLLEMDNIFKISCFLRLNDELNDCAKVTITPRYSINRKFLKKLKSSLYMHGS